MMQQTVTVQVPDILADAYPSPEALERLLFEAMIIKAWQTAHISLGEAAELMNMSYEAFVLWLGSRGLVLTNPTAEEHGDTSHR